MEFLQTIFVFVSVSLSLSTAVGLQQCSVAVWGSETKYYYYYYYCVFAVCERTEYTTVTDIKHDNEMHINLMYKIG